MGGVAPNHTPHIQNNSTKCTCSFRIQCKKGLRRAAPPRPHSHIQNLSGIVPAASGCSARRGYAAGRAAPAPAPRPPPRRRHLRQPAAPGCAGPRRGALQGKRERGGGGGLTKRRRLKWQHRWPPWMTVPRRQALQVVWSVSGRCVPVCGEGGGRTGVLNGSRGTDAAGAAAGDPSCAMLKNEALQGLQGAGFERLGVSSCSPLLISCGPCCLQNPA